MKPQNSTREMLQFSDFLTREWKDSMGALAVVSERVEQLKQDKKSRRCITDSRWKKEVRVQTVALHTCSSSFAFHMTCLHFDLSLPISRSTSSTSCDLTSHIKQHQRQKVSNILYVPQVDRHGELGDLNEGNPRNWCLRERNNWSRTMCRRTSTSSHRHIAKSE